MSVALDLNIPEKMLPFWTEDARYKVAHGGRGGGKSWAVARMLLTKGFTEPMRILCTREVQRTIRDSVHRLLSDQIQELGLGGFYDVQDTEIRGLNGTLFIFSGLSSQTAESIKSFEGVDLVWVEEAQSVSKRSWDILTPTIRKPGSQIWVTFNPELDTDATYQRFVLTPPPGAIVVEINYGDNPWLTPELKYERAHAEASMSPEDYAHIWDGVPRSAVIGAIYAKEVDTLIRGGRVRPVPYDPSLRVHTVWDLGWNDSIAIILVQRVASEVRVIHYIEDDHRTLESIVHEDLAPMKLNWGYDWLPHDGYAATLAASGKSIAAQLKRLGRRVHPRGVPRIGVETGIKTARSLFQRAYLDVEYAARLLECLKRYRRGVNANTGEEGAPVHDEYSHGADAWRGLALVIDDMTNEDDADEQIYVPGWQPRDRTMGI